MTAPVTPPPRGALASLFEQVRERIAGEGVTGSAFRSFVVNVGGAGISFIGQVILARALGEAGFGVYLLALACMNAASVLAKMELDGTSTRFLAGYIGAEQWGHARGYSTWSRRMVRWTSLGVASLGVAIAWFWRDDFARKHEALPAALMVVCGLLVMNAQMLLNSSHLQALKRYVQSQVPGLILRPALLASTVGLWILLGTTPTPAQVIAINLVATTSAVFLLQYWLRRARPAELTRAPMAFEKTRWISAAKGLVTIGIAQLVISQQSDLIVVGWLVGAKETGLYGAAAQFTLLLQFGQTSISFVAAPLIAELHEQKNYVRLQHLVRQVFVANAAIGLPILAILVAFGHLLLRWSYGPAFEAAYPVLVILSIAITTAALVGATAGFLLTMTEYQREAAWIIGGSAVLNLILTLILTPMYGLIGTAIATLCATLARSGVLVWFIRRRMGLSVFPWA